MALRNFILFVQYYRLVENNKNVRFDDLAMCFTGKMSMKRTESYIFFTKASKITN